jgi:hypothetical protein
VIYVHPAGKRRRRQEPCLEVASLKVQDEVISFAAEMSPEGEPGRQGAMPAALFEDDRLENPEIVLEKGGSDLRSHQHAEFRFRRIGFQRPDDGGHLEKIADGPRFNDKDVLIWRERFLHVGMEMIV